MLHERISAKEKPPVLTLDEFIGFTRNPLPENEWQDCGFLGDFNRAKHKWIDLTDMLYGNEELRRVTKNERYKGVEDIRIILEDSLRESGRLGLVDEFSNQLMIVADPDQINTVLPFLDKISDFNL